MLARLAGRLPASRLEAWARILEQAHGPDDQILDALHTRPAAGLTHELETLVAAWRNDQPGLAGRAMALALRSAAATHHSGPTQPSLELVVSGPTSPSVPTRLTSTVVIDVINAAHDSLLVSSFAALGVVDVVAALQQAAERHVRIDLVLEASTSAPTAFRQLRGEFVRLWQRPTGVGVVHAKALAADRHTALLGSANLTDRALAANIEMGLLVRDSILVGRLVDHFNWLTGPGDALRRTPH
ncbi:DISARM system phospholipase D-like protein DrmC [Streptomyces sp. NPDC051684]|uniref:DISARM system phospholipase D-like protein DrmC n=1 Tax=Streptomyces sp. NPDC051684 TaxID=3365670 RepID=UPI0037A3BFD8